MVLITPNETHNESVSKDGKILSTCMEEILALFPVSVPGKTPRCNKNEPSDHRGGL